MSRHATGGQKMSTTGSGRLYGQLLLWLSTEHHALRLLQLRRISTFCKLCRGLGRLWNDLARAPAVRLTVMPNCFFLGGRCLLLRFPPAPGKLYRKIMFDLEILNHVVQMFVAILLNSILLQPLARHIANAKKVRMYKSQLEATSATASAFHPSCAIISRKFASTPGTLLSILWRSEAAQPLAIIVSEASPPLPPSAERAASVLSTTAAKKLFLLNSSSVFALVNGSSRG
mmetsp:Transcript_116141/g.205387  ORF Transcript_116141/g.205387 Transcript_116141/m.205387 type:complete len:230 (+) Transcript_116141:942-1631(+)